ncbi:MAG TPA: protein-tyrosine phosphatase family protein [Vicinamibacterales bacterium]|nr:protein-tyrosine phosphatase family protein [Vicinamibacterales bacterium]
MSAPDPKPVPFPYAYWVIDGLLLAGGYPGDWDPTRARERIRAVLDAGIRLFLDLTEPGELAPYDSVLKEEAAARGIDVRHERSPIPDHGVPGPRQLARILDTIEKAIVARIPVYVHCHGGVGRTGTVIGCWLALRGEPGEAAITRLAKLRCECPDGGWASPETPEQCAFVRQWKPAKRKTKKSKGAGRAKRDYARPEP